VAHAKREIARPAASPRTQAACVCEHMAKRFPQTPHLRLCPGGTGEARG